MLQVNQAPSNSNANYAARTYFVYVTIRVLGALPLGKTTNDIKKLCW